MSDAASQSSRSSGGTSAASRAGTAAAAGEPRPPPSPPPPPPAGASPLYLNPTFAALSITNVYATRSRIFVIGCDQNQEKFRVLKIDRTESARLNIIDDGVVYAPEQIRDLLARIEALGGANSQVVQRRISGYGIFGFVRFLAGYYMIIITKRRKVAMIGAHVIYRIEDTMMISVPNSVARGQMPPGESRYVKMFHNVDITSNFYFSYTYDLTRTLQGNMYRPSAAEIVRRERAAVPPIKPDSRYVWNDYLIRAFQDQVLPCWIVYAVHGFVAQSNLNTFGRSLFVTLIARRSRHFAGTRFMKRGVNDSGETANEVETEQIVHDASTFSHRSGRFTSMIQLRGSVPVFWMQDHGGMKTKPPIFITKNDPFASPAALHFERLFHKYGHPIIALNLVKKKEKRARESKLAIALTSALSYLNQFLPKEEQIVHHCWDMARCNKRKNGNVLRTLDSIASVHLAETGIFHAGKQLFVHETGFLPTTPVADPKEYAGPVIGRNQHGVIRVNCVDCLDRTNTAQFMIGLCALRHQLFALGVLSATDPLQIPFDSHASRLLEELYEDHGDTIALQYGGSQLVNRIQTYRKTKPWTSHSRDILNTVARYYSNSFTDTDKQMAINLFLGKFIPHAEETPLWDMYSDHFLHQHDMRSAHAPSRPHYINWHVPVRPPEIGRFRRGDSVKDDSYKTTTTADVLRALADEVADAEREAAAEGFTDALEIVADTSSSKADGIETRSITGPLPELPISATNSKTQQPGPANQYPDVDRLNLFRSMPIPSGNRGGVPSALANADEDLFSTPPSTPVDSGPAGANAAKAASASADPQSGVDGIRRAASSASLAASALASRESNEMVQTLRRTYVSLRRAVVQQSDLIMLPDAHGANDRFDNEVKQGLASWGISQPSGQDYVTVARLVAARHNLIDGWIDLPRPPPPLIKEDNWFFECYPPVFESLEELYPYSMTTTAKLTAPASTPDCSPFRSVLSQVMDELGGRQYDRLAIKPDQVRVAAQAPVEDGEDADSDNELGSDGDDDTPLRPIMRALGPAEEYTSVGAEMQEPETDQPLLPPLRVILVEPETDVQSCYDWHAEPWLLGIHLLERSNAASILAARAALDADDENNRALLAATQADAMATEVAQVDPATPETAAALVDAIQDELTDVVAQHRSMNAGRAAAAELQRTVDEQIGSGAENTSRSSGGVKPATVAGKVPGQAGTNIAGSKGQSAAVGEEREAADATTAGGAQTTVHTAPTISVLAATLSPASLNVDDEIDMVDSSGQLMGAVADDLAAVLSHAGRRMTGGMLGGTTAARILKLRQRERAEARLLEQAERARQLTHRPPTLQQISHSMPAATTGFDGDGWPEMRAALGPATAGRGGPSGPALETTVPRLLAATALEPDSRQRYEDVVNMGRSGVPRTRMEDSEVFQAYLGRSKGRLAEPITLNRSAYGMPLRPLA